MSGEVTDAEGYVGHSFLDLSPLRRTQGPYITPSDKELPSVPKFSKFSRLPTSSSSPTVNYIKRISIFVLLELGFIILAALSLRKPIFVGPSDNLDGAKGGFTVLFIMWQAAAIIPLQHIIVCILSHEWSVQWSNTETTLQHLDRIDQVSTLTSNFLDRFRFLVRGKSSTSFKLAFATSVALLGLATLGPGSVGAATVRRSVQVNVNIRRLELTRGGDDDSSASVVLQRAQMVSYLEQMGDSPYGLDVQPNHIVGWPPRELRKAGFEVVYPSDIVRFNSTCQWEVPSLNEKTKTVRAGGEDWTLGVDVTQVSGDGGILPLLPVNDTSLSAYLFHGSNDTYGGTNTSQHSLNLGNVPALFNISGLRDPLFPMELNSPLVSVLICDPQLQITGGYVHLHLNGTLVPKASGPAIIGNIPRPAANFLFAHSLSTTVLLDATANQRLSIIADLASTRIFLDQSNLTGPTIVNKPSNLDNIGRNIDAFLLSASKAFTDDYVTKDNSMFTTVPVQGTTQEEVMALTATEPLLIITIILSVLVIILATALCTNAPVTLELFNLDTISGKLQEKVPESPQHHPPNSAGSRPSSQT